MKRLFSLMLSLAIITSFLSLSPASVVIAAQEGNEVVITGSLSSSATADEYSITVDLSVPEPLTLGLLNFGEGKTTAILYDNSGNKITAVACGYDPTALGNYSNVRVENIPKQTADNTSYVLKVTGTAKPGSSYKVFVCDTENLPTYIGGKENAVNLTNYVDQKGNWYYSPVLPTTEEHWYKFTAQANTAITINNNYLSLYFDVYDINSDNLIYRSSTDPTSHRTTYLAFNYCDKARPKDLIAGKEYYLKVYALQEKPNQANWMMYQICVGNPMLRLDSTTSTAASSISVPSSGYSATSSVAVKNVPKTAAINQITILASGCVVTDFSSMETKANTEYSWRVCPLYSNILYIPYTENSANNVKISGSTWNIRFKGNGKSKTTTPGLRFDYSYEIGD